MAGTRRAPLDRHPGLPAVDQDAVAARSLALPTASARSRFASRAGSCSDSRRGSSPRYRRRRGWNAGGDADCGRRARHAVHPHQRRPDRSRRQLRVRDDERGRRTSRDRELLPMVHRGGLRRLDLPAPASRTASASAPTADTMYFCDSPTGRIMQCRYDAGVGGRLRHRRVRVRLGASAQDSRTDRSSTPTDACGMPPGGGRWSGAIARTERSIARGTVPAKNPTCVVFGRRGA